MTTRAHNGPVAILVVVRLLSRVSPRVAFVPRTPGRLEKSPRLINTRELLAGLTRANERQLGFSI